MKLEPDLSNPVQAQMGFDFDAPTKAQERTELEREEAHFYIARMRESLERAGEKPHDMRTPCQFCDCPVGVLVVQSGQNTVRCAQCRRHSYNASKTETGQIARTVRTLRTHIKPSQQARILDRDHGRCVLCGASDDLTIGHLLSIADGARLGATESEMNDDANLAAMCEGCNAGLGARSISTRTYLIIMLRTCRPKSGGTDRAVSRCRGSATASAPDPQPAAPSVARVEDCRYADLSTDHADERCITRCITPPGADFESLR